MTGSLTAKQFTDFFGELHRKNKDDEPPEPFPWQRELVSRVAETGIWPELLDVPTGAGKTAALDAAVFLLALREEGKAADSGPCGRTPLRQKVRREILRRG